jgi:nitrite reductase/ring-hydroxylating ferredoxin subunit
MDLPESIIALGEQLATGGTIAADPKLFEGADVFAAERQGLFLQPWIAVDHQSRITAPGRYVRVDAANRSILLVRDAEGELRALRNVCLHAGYPICEAEEGPSERMVCPYHGWEFAADGRLVEPDLSARIDPARLRLASHPLCIRDGLVFVDLSKSATDGDGAAATPSAAALPAWLPEAEVISRSRYAGEWNWKLALQFGRCSADLACDDDDNGELIEFGPLSLMAVTPRRAALLSVIPKSAGRTELQLIRMTAPGERPSAGPDRFAEELQAAAAAANATAAGLLDREFFDWYWLLMSAG